MEPGFQQKITKATKRKSPFLCLLRLFAAISKSSSVGAEVTRLAPIFLVAAGVSRL
jgi:hypothetical protein